VSVVTSRFAELYCWASWVQFTLRPVWVIGGFSLHWDLP